jgi:hypothetical protein
VYIRYQSREDLLECEDIMRCNPSFHGRTRNDTIIVNAADFQYARLELLFRVFGPGDSFFDMALVRAYRQSSWRPRTLWDGCRVYEPGQPELMKLDYLVRGALMVDTNLRDLTGRHYYLDDLVDNDVFLRLNLSEDM